MQPDLNQLMARTAEGDTSAFRQLADALNGVLYAEGRRVLQGQMDLIEDAAQEALINLWRNAPRWENRWDTRKEQGDRAVAAYARTVMHHAAIDILRTRNRRQEDSIEDAPYDEPAVGASAETALEMQDALAALTPQQRRAALMFYAEGIEQKEIANDMGTSEKAIERMLAYARQKLKALRKRGEQ